ncbi:MAG: 3-oxoacyl-ACP reductase FabG [Armatimonadetes bacterium]|nr:3-oxoacyl-ACP reductase FabG [Armatimonadota bacterium]
MRMAGKKVLVTGASRGIGRGIALAMAGEGASVAVTYVKGSEKAGEVVRAIREGGGEAFELKSDVGQRADCEHLINKIREHWGSLDVLVNNAGRLDPIMPGDVGLEAFEKTIETNLKGTWLMSRLAAPLLRASQGSIVNIASIAGSAGYPYAAHYAASKAGVIAMTRSLALELAPGVRVNGISPGYTNTGDPSGWSEERMGDLAKAIPLQRFGRPEDVAAAAIFLAVEATYVTGTTLVVDGGLTLRLPGFVSGL